MHISAEEARATQTVHIAVHPRAPLDVVREGDALTLQPGAEVLETDFVAGQTVTHALAELLANERVTVLSDDERRGRVTTTAARYVVAPGGSVNTTNRGHVDEGGPVTADCFAGGQVDLDDLVRRGVIVDRGANAGAANDG